MIPQELSDLASTVQLLLHRTGSDEYPFSFQGTAFFVGVNGRAFVVTARHCVTKGQESLMPLCIFPNDTSNKCLPLSDGVLVPGEAFVDELGDLAIVEIDRGRLDAETVEANVIDLNKSGGEWCSAAPCSKFVVVGYPDDYSNLDSTRKVILHQRFMIEGSYVAQSKDSLLHELAIQNTHNLSTLSGFSGSPVFALIEKSEQQFEIVFCGVASRGSTNGNPEQRIHFTDRQFLALAINRWCGIES